MIESADMIALEFCLPMVGFRRKLAERLGLEISDEYNPAWDSIVNG